VFSAFCEEFGLEKKARRENCLLFGGGIGHLGEVCGAVSVLSWFWG
jgi:hypothetical protein